MIDRVFEFQRRCLGIFPQETPHLQEPDRTFFVTALREEARELEDAEHGPRANMEDEESRRQTVVAQVDALIDAAYFAIGGLAHAGLTQAQAEACFSAVHLCNMRKKMGIKDNRGDMGVPDAVKPDGWTGPEEAIYGILFGD